MSDPMTYEERLKEFDWAIAERELGWKRGEPINIGWYCSDRICGLVHGSRPALLWEGSAGEERRYTYDDLRVLSNTIAAYLQRLGIQPGERVCLFLDRVPELYIGFLGILKMGGIAQPLFSAFGDESLHTRLDNAQTSAIVTQRKHVAKVRKIRDSLPALKHVVVVDAGDGPPLQAREVPLALDQEPRVETFTCFPSEAETPSVLHYTSGTTGQPKGAQHVHSSLVAQYLTSKWVLDLKPEDICILDFDQNLVSGKRVPSLEASMHLSVYRNRPEVGAVLHTHQHYASVLSVINEPIPPLFDEVSLYLGDPIEVVPYGMSGSPELMANVTAALGNGCNGYILQNHGALCLGRTLEEAATNAELLEKTAKVYYHALCTGKEIGLLPREILDVFQQLRKAKSSPSS